MSTINIAVLDADVPVPAVRSVRSTYTAIFAELLEKATSKIQFRDIATPTLAFKHYDVVLGDYPADISQVDGVLITGSAASAYEDQPWINKLNTFIRDTYTNHPRIRFFGSCFGHQIICQALLAQSGVHVTKDPNGWEIGVHTVTLTPDFRDSISQSLYQSPSDVPSNMRFQFIHADHVVIPETASLPADWTVMGSSEHCAVQGVLQTGRVLTFQGHFEFDRFINGETFKVFTTSWNQTAIDEGLALIDADDDSEMAAEMAARFLIGLTGGLKKKKTGLLTPPEEE